MCYDGCDLMLRVIVFCFLISLEDCFFFKIDLFKLLNNNNNSYYYRNIYLYDYYSLNFFGRIFILFCYAYKSVILYKVKILMLANI